MRVYYDDLQSDGRRYGATPLLVGRYFSVVLGSIAEETEKENCKKNCRPAGAGKKAKKPFGASQAVSHCQKTFMPKYQRGAAKQKPSSVAS